MKPRTSLASIGHRGSQWRIPRWSAILLILAQLAITVFALSVPAHLERLRMLQRELSPQVAAIPMKAAAPVPAPTSTSPQLLVLAYRGVQEQPTSPNSVTPAQFADHLDMLNQAGYSSATGDDIEALLNGRPVSGRKLLITFDGSVKGIWTYADPILSHYRMRAIAFVATGDVGTHQPYYLTWPELRAMQRSGRWDFGSQTHAGQRPIPIAPSGARGGFLSSIQWIAPEHRYETLGEYRARVASDLATSRAELQRHGLPSPRFLALPYDPSHKGLPKSKVSGILTSVTRAQFDATFRSLPSAGPITRTDLRARLLPRIKVTGQMSADALFWRLHRVTAVHLRRANLRQEADWCCTAGNRNVNVDATNRWNLLGARQGGWRLSVYGPSRQAGWTNYQFAATANGLEASGAAAVRVVGHGTRELQVLLTRDQARVITVSSTGRRREVARSPLASRGSHRSLIEVHPHSTTVSVDGIHIVRLVSRRGGIGLGVLPDHSGHSPWFSDVSVAPSVG